MKRFLMSAAVVAALPVAAQAQSLQSQGFYIGAEGGLNWMLNNSFTTTLSIPGVFSGSGTTNSAPATGWAAGGMIGYDFVGPRVEIEALYRDNKSTITENGIPGTLGADFNQTSIMANVLYDFMAGQTITPYIGAGAGIAFTNFSLSGLSSSSTAFAYQGIIGVGWNINEQLRLNLDGRYFGTTNPNYSFSGNVAGFPATLSGSYPNNNFSVMASLQYKFGSPAVAAPPPAAPSVTAPSFMVFFDWDRANLSAQALSTIKQAADVYKTKGNARITATGHTDTSGPESYNMALSLRRANAVKDALVRNGVPATAISVVGKGEQGLLVPTADGVREPQNRRVVIEIQ
ncbi:OmpA family protein [Enhydrobacter aerosaccus]|uniref:OmpA family protein n=2 Tax=Enhydrobacter aerosaccus TaxID=225324 RepID=A0A1T4TFD1_9HYPH|nr:OmpA family protein [Enhydrobacter aerosaccus]SKA39144.1 OmpA family protein [Enhydrobacter aerosaccus]